MSISAPPGGPPPGMMGGPSSGGPPPSGPSGGGGPDDDAGKSLHDTAVDAQTDVQKLATGLAHAGASPQAVQQLTQFAEVLGQVVKVLAQAPEVEHAAQAGGPQHAAVQHAIATAPPPPPGAPPNSMPGAGFHQATQQLHQALAAKRAGQ